MITKISNDTITVVSDDTQLVIKLTKKYWFRKGDNIRCKIKKIGIENFFDGEPTILLNEIKSMQFSILFAIRSQMDLELYSFPDFLTRMFRYLNLIKFKNYIKEDIQLFRFFCRRFDHHNQYDDLISNNSYELGFDAGPEFVTQLRHNWVKDIFVRRLVLLGMNENEIFTMRNLGYNYNIMYNHLRKYPYRIWAFDLDKAHSTAERFLIPEAEDPAHKNIAEVYRLFRSKSYIKVNLPSEIHSFYNSEFNPDTGKLRLDYQILAEEILKDFIKNSKKAQDIQDEPRFEYSEHLDEMQRQAINTALTKRVSCITGQAGSGKTTVIKEIYSALHEKENVYILAFTGKAVSRIKELFDEECYTAMTIHKFFETAIFPTNLTVIIDEMSMVDGILFTRVTQYLYGKNVRYVLVGDPNQLMPIEFGTPFDDIRKELPVTHLSKNHRQLNKLNFVLNDVMSGNFNSKAYNFPEFKVNFELNNFDVFKVMIKNILTKVDFNILCPYNEESNLINKFCDKLFGGGHKFYVGQKIMFTKNWNDIYNNSQGVISEVSEEKVVISTNYGEKRISTDETSEYSTKFIKSAWCITVHKSQGSEYQNCIFYLPRVTPFVTKSMIYTAFSRARKYLFFVTSLTEDKFKELLN